MCTMESVGRLLWLTAKESREGLERRLQAAGGSMATWLILHALEDQEGNHQRELAEHLCLEGATVTRHLDRLEAEGLIERRPDALDRRGTCVYSTPAGRRTLKKLWSVVSQA